MCLALPFSPLWEVPQIIAIDMYFTLFSPYFAGLPDIRKKVSRGSACPPEVFRHRLRDPGRQHLLRAKAPPGLPAAGPAGHRQWTREHDLWPAREAPARQSSHLNPK